MVKIGIEVRVANSIKGVMDYCKITKEEALMDFVNRGMEALHNMVPDTANYPYKIVPSKEWTRLSKTLYYFKESQDAQEGICIIRKKPVTHITAETLWIYIVFPQSAGIPELEVMVLPTMSDTL